MSAFTQHTVSPKVAFLGLGAMGRRMSRRLLAGGVDLVVFSRSGVPDDAPELRARAASSPCEAAARADVVISMVSDDDASRAVWTDPERGALSSLRPETLAIECSTLGVEWVNALAGSVRAAGAEFVDGPVVGSRPQAETGALIFLAGGSAAAVERARPVLSTMGGALHHLGPTAAGATAKLIVNALLGVQVAALAELWGVARRAGLDAGALAETTGALPVVSLAAKGALASMLAHRFEPLFPLALVEKDLRYALAMGRVGGAQTPVTERVAEVVRSAVAAGLAAENLTALAKLY